MNKTRMGSPQEPVLSWVIPEWVLETSYAEMAADGLRDREGVALWAGSRCSSNGEWVANSAITRVTVSHVLLLRGRGVYKARGLIRISPEIVNDVTDRLATLGDNIYLVGQVHGHPPFASTDLSDTDVACGIRTPGYLSVVAPHYGMRPHERLRECGVHVFERQLGWRRLARIEVEHRVVISTAATPASSVITVDADAGMAEL